MRQTGQEENTVVGKIHKAAEKAENIIRPFIRETPLEHSPYLSLITSSEVYLKLENMQITGSFKLRGAMNKILSLTPSQLKKGLITASSGNHGAAFAYLVDRFRIKGTIYLPESAPKTKIDALRHHNAEIKLGGNDCILAEIAARSAAESTGRKYISPYNDLAIIGGQATIGVELQRQSGKTNAVFIPIGGGGLAAGIGGYLKAFDKNIAIIGCQPESSPVMYESVKAGHIVEMESKPTISDGTAGGIEKNAITLDICREVIDDFVLVSEKEIRDAIKLILERHYLLIEGAAALSVAAFLKTKNKYSGKCVVLIISGAKISLGKLQDILCDQEGTS
ncbi:MAG: threonine/serine dehydratase [Candidatus Aminicenantes bacterium]|nr:threonine/serine dehydratase [Candidatus Aminicenantes bacterium]